MFSSQRAPLSGLAFALAATSAVLLGCSSNNVDGSFGGSGNLGGTGGQSAATGGVTGSTGGSQAVAGAVAGGTGGALQGSAGSGSSVGGSPAAGSAGTAGAPSSACASPPETKASWVCVNGYKLMVGKRQADGSLATLAPYKLKGVGWSPTGVGEQNTAGYTMYYTKYGAQDAPLMGGMNANTVKTYSPFELNQNGIALLDKLYAQGIMVVMTVMPSYWDAQNKKYLDTVNYFKGHPAILMWLIGNEMNYNKLYNNSLSLDAAVGLAATAIDDIHAADPSHPVAVSWGNSPFDGPASYYTQLHADVWSLNLYAWLDLTARFGEWQKQSQKPMFVGEYGADAWNAKLTPPAEDQDSQAKATQMLTQQIASYYSATTAHAVLGGCAFELTDEWWKGGDPTTHSTGGFANGGVYADGYANEGWWGLLNVQRQPRKAYDALKAIYAMP